MAELLIILSAIIGAAGLYPYIKSTIAGTVRPQLVTWSIWTVLASILTISAIQQNQLASAVLSAHALVGCGLVVAFGWKTGQVRLTKLDIASIAGAVIGIASLVVFQDPTTALIISVMVDAVAFIPTIRHAFVSPHEESLVCFALGSAAALLAILAASSRHSEFSGLFYPLYSFVFNGGVALIIFFGRQPTEEPYFETSDA